MIRFQLKLQEFTNKAIKLIWTYEFVKTILNMYYQFLVWNYVITKLKNKIFVFRWKFVYKRRDCLYCMGYKMWFVNIRNYIRECLNICNTINIYKCYIICTKSWLSGMTEIFCFFVFVIILLLFETVWLL